MPFKRIPDRMIIELIAGVVYWLNMFPPNDGIHPHLSPRALITGVRPDYKTHCKVEFGAYVHTHEQHDNSMQPRTVGAIALRPANGTQGGFYFLSLSTGRRIHRQRFTELPMPEEVIQQVHLL